MKKLWKSYKAFFAVCVCLLVGLCGCGTATQNKETEEHEEEESNTNVVTLQEETRGVWHRPNVMGNETSLQGVCQTLDTFAEAGINTVFVESFYHGMTMYQSEYVPYYSGFSSYQYGEYPDYLTAFVQEAKKRDIVVHAWVEDFYIGISSSTYLAQNHPDWLMLTKAGNSKQSEGNGYIFLDPANTEVRTFLVNLYDEMLQKVPDLVGLNLDYIRYPVSSSSDDTGYTQAAMLEFAEQAGHSLQNSTSLKDDFVEMLNTWSLQKKWTAYRADCVSKTVGEICNMMRTKHTGKYLSTAVFPDADSTYETKKQDFNKWISYGYLDIVTPMAYYDNTDTLTSALNTMLKSAKNCICYAGLSATYHNLSVEKVFEQTEACKSCGTQGFIFFGSQSILGNQTYLSAFATKFKN